MYQTYPGTTIETGASALNRPNTAAEVLTNIFAGGGLVLSQVSNLTGLEYYIIQNWVKRGFLSPPVKKQYSKRQFCRIVIINALKDVMQIERIVRLLTYINGVLADESDDLIDDSELYNYYVNAVFASDGVKTPEELVSQTLEGYNETVPGAKKRLGKVLLVMYYAGLASENAKKCEQLIYELD